MESNRTGVTGELADSKKGAAASGTAGTSRRDFLKGTAAATAGIIFGISAAGASGCSSSSPSNGDGTTKTDRPATVVETDVLIIGGGHAATTAARHATSIGQRVIIVDKGKFGHSATSGINWGQTIVTPEFSPDHGEKGTVGFLLDTNGMMDQNWASAVIQGCIDGMVATSSEQIGAPLQRNPDGIPKGLENPEAVLGLTYENRNRFAAQYVARTGAEIYPHTAMVDILVSDDGHVAGAVGIDFRNGDAYVFRAKTVIMATGSYAYACGNSISGPETTGVGHKIFMQRGLEMMNMEFLIVDLESWQPYGEKHEKGMEATINAGLLNGDNWDHFYNGDKVQFTAGYFDSPEYKNDEGSIFTYVYNKAMIEILSGRGTENGGIYCGDMKGLSDRTDLGWSQFVSTARGEGTSAIGYEMPDYQECVVEVYQTGGTPASQTDKFETEIPGLYSALQGNSTYGSTMSLGQGWVTGGAAAEAAAKIEKLPTIKWSDVQDVLDYAFGFLEAAPEKPMPAIEIYDKIRAATRAGLVYPIDAKGIQACIDELTRIQKEDRPRVYVRSKSKIMNRDWMNALELDEMLMCTLATAKASLMREETRPYFVRSDFPKMDNDKWLKNIIVKYENGEFSLRTKDIVDTIVPAEQLKKIMPPIDFTPTVG
ncbi:MAG: FAD-binding protein [Coriobacteriia bacterium]